MEQTTELTELISSLFSMEEAIRFIKYSRYSNLIDFIPNTPMTTPNDVFKTIAGFIEQEKIPTKDFFMMLIEERPRRIFDINNVRKLYI